MSQLARGRARSLTSVVTAWGPGGDAPHSHCHICTRSMLYARVRPPAPCPARRACQTQRLAACSLRLRASLQHAHAAGARGGAVGCGDTRKKAGTRRLNPVRQRAQVNTAQPRQGRTPERPEPEGARAETVTRRVRVEKTDPVWSPLRRDVKFYIPPILHKFYCQVKYVKGLAGFIL